MVVTYRNTRTGRLAEVNDDKLVVLMDRSTRWQRAEAKSSLRTAQEIPSAEPKPAEVRAWAKEQGIDVSPRGKLPADLVEQYKAAHEE